MRNVNGMIWWVVGAGLLLAGTTQAHPAGEYGVISTATTNLSKVRALGPEADVLGIHRESQSVQIRLPLHRIAELEDAGIHVTELDSQGFVTGSALQGYKSPGEVTTILENMASQHPAITRLKELGRSHENRPVYALELGFPESIRIKPAILFNGMHHAREVMTTEVILDIAEYVLANQNTPEVRGWLENYQIILVPQVNPDGGHRVHEGDRWWRKNAWKQGSMVWGVDLNRNYPTLWSGCNGSSGSVLAQDYRGPQAASEPETQAMITLVSEAQPVFNISYHSYSELIIYPFGCERERNPSVETFRRIAVAMAEEIRDDSGRTGTYQIGTAPELLYQADGTDLDYQWQEHNVIAYTLEVNSRSQGFQPDFGRWRDKTVEAQRGGWMTLMRRMEEGGVRAIFAPDTVQSLTLQVKTATGYSRWDRGRNKKAGLRQGQLLYQLLEDGSYRLLVEKKDGSQVAHEFVVRGRMTNLGQL